MAMATATPFAPNDNANNNESAPQGGAAAGADLWHHVACWVWGVASGSIEPPADIFERKVTLSDCVDFHENLLFIRKCKRGGSGGEGGNNGVGTSTGEFRSVSRSDILECRSFHKNDFKKTRILRNIDRKSVPRFCVDGVEDSLELCVQVFGAEKNTACLSSSSPRNSAGDFLFCRQFSIEVITLRKKKKEFEVPDLMWDSGGFLNCFVVRLVRNSVLSACGGVGTCLPPVPASKRAREETPSVSITRRRRWVRRKKDTAVDIFDNNNNFDDMIATIIVQAFCSIFDFRLPDPEDDAWGRCVPADRVVVGASVEETVSELVRFATNPKSEASTISILRIFVLASFFRVLSSSSSIFRSIDGNEDGRSTPPPLLDVVFKKLSSTDAPTSIPAILRCAIFSWEDSATSTRSCFGEEHHQHHILPLGAWIFCRLADLGDKEGDRWKFSRRDPNICEKLFCQPSFEVARDVFFPELLLLLDDGESQKHPTPQFLLNAFGGWSDEHPAEDSNISENVAAASQGILRIIVCVGWVCEGIRRFFVAPSSKKTESIVEGDATTPITKKMTPFSRSAVLAFGQRVVNGVSSPLVGGDELSVLERGAVSLFVMHTSKKYGIPPRSFFGGSVSELCSFATTFFNENAELPAASMPLLFFIKESLLLV